MVPNIKKETFLKEIHHLVNIGMLAPIQQLEYVTPVFIIPNKEVNIRFITGYLNINH